MHNRQTSLAYRQELLPYSIPYLADNDNLINILLVEDDYSDTLLTIQRINATQIPYNMDRITEGGEVLPYLKNCLQTRLPDLMLLDMGLPGVDGFEILERLAQSPATMRAIPIAIVTGHRNFDYLSTTYQNLPIYGYLTKPLHVEDINAILAKVTGFRQ